MGRSNRREKNKSSGGFNNRSYGFSRPGFGEREMHKAKCSECGNDCEVPFKPTEGKPVYCKECYQKRKSWWVYVHLH